MNRAVKSCAITGAVAALTCPIAASGQAVSVKPVAAPNFTMRAAKGASVSLASLRGKVVLLHFWASWCPPARESLPAVQALYAKYRPYGLVVLGISDDKSYTAKGVPAAVKRYGLTYPTVTSPDGNKRIFNRYGVDATPTVFLIDRRGRIRWYMVGYSSDDDAELERAVYRLLAEQESARVGHARRRIHPG